MSQLRVTVGISTNRVYKPRAIVSAATNHEKNLSRNTTAIGIVPSLGIITNTLLYVCITNVSVTSIFKLTLGQTGIKRVSMKI